MQLRGFIHISDLLHSLSIEPTWFNTRLVAFSCLTFIWLIHGTLLKWGLRFQNTLGVTKLLVLALISMSGILCLAGVEVFQVREEYEKPDNFRWETLWEGSGTGLNAFINGLYNVIWCASKPPVSIHGLLLTDVFFKGLLLATRALMLYSRKSAILYEPSNWRLLSPWWVSRRYTFWLTFHISRSFPRQIS